MTAAPMATPKLVTVRDLIAWCYANVACAHSALAAGRIKHKPIDWMIRAKLFRGLREGTMRMGGLFDDERIKLVEQPKCTYCGAEGQLSIDHLIPRVAGGADGQHNLVRACRSCNSSKGKRDLLLWYDRRGTFPPVLLLRRYLKLVASSCDAAGLLECSLDDPRLAQLPFEIERLPRKFPPLKDLAL